jgi:hypothetical protein
MTQELEDRSCLSVKSLDLWALRALEPTLETQAKTHLTRCPSCRERLGELMKDQQRFTQFVFPRTVDSVLERAWREQGLWRKGAWYVAAGLAALWVMAGLRTG